MKPHLFIVYICFTLLSACKKDKAEPTPPDVYVAGSEINNAGRPVGKVWKNGELLQILSDGAEFTYIHSLFVTPSNDVYVAGQVVPSSFSSASNAVLWKNGTRSPLGIGNTGAARGRAISVYVQSNDVYVAGEFVGRDAAFNDTTVAVLWKNGSPSLLSTKHSSASDVFVDGNDVYVVGYERNSLNRDVVKIWKNGDPIIFTTGGNSARAFSGCVHQGDIYAVGWEQNASNKLVAKLWKNGVSTSLSDGSQSTTAASIYISGEDIYIAGYESINSFGDRSAILWKNGVSTKLSPGNQHSSAGDVVVHDGEVYVSGDELRIVNSTGVATALVWKNGVATDLQLENPTKSSAANSVFIKHP